MPNNDDSYPFKHVWAEVLNPRGDSMRATIEALRHGGWHAEANRLDLVARDKATWNTYAEQTFLALTKVIPAQKLRYLQYVKSSDYRVWKKYQRMTALPKS